MKLKENWHVNARSRGFDWVVDLFDNKWTPVAQKVVEERQSLQAVIDMWISAYQLLNPKIEIREEERNEVDNGDK